MSTDNDNDRMVALFRRRLDGFYPDGVVRDLPSHGSLYERLVDAAPTMGFPTYRDLLESWGYTVMEGSASAAGPSADVPTPAVRRKKRGRKPRVAPAAVVETAQEEPRPEAVAVDEREPDPAVIPESRQAPESAGAPDSAVAPEPAAAPEPVVAPEPVTEPEPIVEQEPAPVATSPDRESADEPPADGAAALPPEGEMPGDYALDLLSGVARAGLSVTLANPLAAHDLAEGRSVDLRPVDGGGLEAWVGDDLLGAVDRDCVSIYGSVDDAFWNGPLAEAVCSGAPATVAEVGEGSEGPFALVTLDLQGVEVTEMTVDVEEPVEEGDGDGPVLPPVAAPGSDASESGDEEPAPEPEPACDLATKPESEFEPEAWCELAAEPGSAYEPEPQVAPEPEPDSEPEPESEPEMEPQVALDAGPAPEPAVLSAEPAPEPAFVPDPEVVAGYRRQIDELSEQVSIPAVLPDRTREYDERIAALEADLTSMERELDGLGFFKRARKKELTVAVAGKKAEINRLRDERVDHLKAVAARGHEVAEAMRRQAERDRKRLDLEAELADYECGR